MNPNAPAGIIGAAAPIKIGKLGEGMQKSPLFNIFGKNKGKPTCKKALDCAAIRRQNGGVQWMCGMKEI